ncbi:MAG: hypothetical protein WB425_16110 [Terracidiphilus sp.]|jgi:hypothetical protein
MMTPEELREKLETRHGILIDYRWARKRYYKEQGLADYPEEECIPTPPTPEELAERRRRVEYVLGTLLVCKPDEETKRVLDDYACGGDDRVGIVLMDILKECGAIKERSLV